MIDDRRLVEGLDRAEALSTPKPAWYVAENRDAEPAARQC
jgi:hypothetical protein